MRKQFFKGMLFAGATLISLTACTSEETTPAASTSYLRAKVGGTEFSSKVAGKDMVVAMKMGDVINITGSNGANAEVINLILEGITEPGTYTVNQSAESVLSYSNMEEGYDTKSCADAVGTVVVKAIDDNKIEGTFSFTGRVMGDCTYFKEVTDGAFKATFAKQ